MSLTKELRELAAEALRKSDGADYLHEAQWFLKLRRVLTEAADEFERRHNQPATPAAVADLDGGPQAGGAVVRMRRNG